MVPARGRRRLSRQGRTERLGADDCGACVERFPVADRRDPGQREYRPQDLREELREHLFFLCLTNVEKWTEGEEPEVTVRRYMLRSELDKIYEKRIEKIRDMVAIADGALEKAKVDMALQYYYWAYSLARSCNIPRSEG